MNLQKYFFILSACLLLSISPNTADGPDKATHNALNALEPTFDSNLTVQTIIAPNRSIHQAFGIGILPTPNNQILLTEKHCRNLVVLKEDTIVKKIPIVIPNRRISISQVFVDKTGSTKISPICLHHANALKITPLVITLDYWVSPSIPIITPITSYISLSRCTVLKIATILPIPTMLYCELSTIQPP